MRIVLDTNVLVSGLLSPNGPPAKLFRHLESSALRLLLDSRILDEYRSVTSRPELGIATPAATVIEALEAKGEKIEPEPYAGTLPDPTDLPSSKLPLPDRPMRSSPAIAVTSPRRSAS